MSRRWTLIVGLATTLAACGGDESPEPEPVIEEARATLDSLRAPALVRLGSPIDATVGVGQLDRRAAELVVTDGDRTVTVPPTAPLTFAASGELVALIEAGAPLTAFLDDGAARTVDRPVSWAAAPALAPALAGVASAPAYYGQNLVLLGDDFLLGEEGTVTARFAGAFTPVDGDSAPVDVVADAVTAERFGRDRALVALPTALGGLREGTFDGTIEVTCTPQDGAAVSTSALPFSVSLLAPEVFRVADDSIWLGGTLDLVGGGFVDEPGVTTLVAFDGTFTHSDGVSASYAQELFLDRADDDVGRIFLRASEVDGALVSAQFGARAGRFEGTVAVTVTNGSVTQTGAPAPVAFDVLGVRQVVWVNFLPGFYDSLDRFGLGAAAGAIEAEVAARIDSIFADYAVDVRLIEPTDVEPNHVTRIEIGGPDPNGIGLFGFDNTPGKDLNNVRLFDVIGGANFATQADGYPGYGGVFIESMLWWATDPPAGDRPVTAPDPDPDFDRLFSPFFAVPASPTEVAGAGEPDRVAMVNDAITALANAIGETAAHELGHSFGLAQPGLENVFHNNGDRPGCLMDHGADRPFGERAALPGFSPTHLCDEAPAYMESILPLP